VKGESERTVGSVLQDVSHGLEVLPNDQGLNGSHVESLEGILDSEDELSSVESDLIEELLDELLLLDELDVGERVGGEIDGLRSRKRGIVRGGSSRRATRVLEEGKRPTWLKPFSPP